MKRILVLLLLVYVPILTMAQTNTKTVNLSVSDASTTNPTGTLHACYHKIYGGTYGERKDLASNQSYAWVLSSPALGSHFFVCVAYVKEGTNTTESAYSNEVVWVNPPQPPVLTITSVVAIPQFKGVILQASTEDTPTRAYVEYGIGQLLNQFVSDSGYRTGLRSITLDKLRPHTKYSYCWTVTAQDGRSMQSAVYTFTTL